MRRLPLILFVLLFASAAFAQEAKVHLTTPITQPTTAVSDYLPVSELIQVRPTPAIVVRIQGTDGRIETFSYPCPTVVPPAKQICTFNTDASVMGLINTLNTTNLSTRSLWRLTMDRIVADFPAFFVGGATVQ